MYYGYGLVVAMRYCTNEETAKEVLSDSFLKVFQKLHTYKINTNFKAWFGKIVANTAIDKERSTGGYIYKDLAHAETQLSTENQAVSSLHNVDVLRMLRLLPERYRLVINLHEFEGYSHQEIGSMLGIGESSSRALLSRGRKILKDILNKTMKRDERIRRKGSY